MTLPVVPIVQSVLLEGLTNGRLPATALWDTPGLADGPTVRLISPAARAWRALTAAALLAGHTLKATSLVDSYRPYEVQERIFRARYRTVPMYSGQTYKTWNGERWYHWYGAAAATPGWSNHGLGQAVDTGEESDGDLGTESLDTETLNWLAANERRFGWSHELQSEPWHLHYFAGDAIPQAVLDYEAQTDEMSPEQEAKFEALIIERTGAVFNEVGRAAGDIYNAVIPRLDALEQARSGATSAKEVVDELGARLSPGA